MTRPKLAVVQPEKEEHEVQVIVRPERNIDRLPAIWAPSNGRVAAKVKTINFDVNLNGNSVSAQLVILPGTMYVEPSKREQKKQKQKTEKLQTETRKEVRVILTTFDQRVFLVLVKIWEEEEKKDTYIYFSMRRIARELGLEWGSETMRLIEESLYRLKLVTLDWQKSFVTKNGENVEITMLEPTNILAALKIVKRKEGGKVVKEKGYFRFDSSIESNLKATYTRPVRLDVICSFTNHRAQLIYTLIDREMYGDIAKPFQMRSENLFRVLGLTGGTYKYKSKRIEALEPALKELIGKPLSSGEIITRAELRETADKQDCKVFFEKGTHIRALPEQKTKAAEENPLVKRLREELHIGRKQAIECAEHHQDFASEILAAKESFPDWQRKTGGFWFKAIIERYELPPVYLGGRAEAEKKRMHEARSAAQAACPFCKDSSVPGMRYIKAANHPRGTYKHCSHDAEKENQFESAE